MENCKVSGPHRPSARCTEILSTSPASKFIKWIPKTFVDLSFECKCPKQKIQHFCHFKKN